MIARITTCLVAGVLVSWLLSIRFTVDPRSATRVNAELYKHQRAPDTYPEPVLVTTGFNFIQAFRIDHPTEALAMPQGRGIVLSELVSGSPFTMGDNEHRTTAAQSYQGWPLKCFVVEWRENVRGNQFVPEVDGGFVAADESQLTRGVPVTNRAVVLPFKPIAHKLILNSLLWAGVMLVAWECALMVHGRRTPRAGRCSCGYPLGGLSRCPECGRERGTGGLRTK